MELSPSWARLSVRLTDTDTVRAHQKAEDNAAAREELGWGPDAEQRTLVPSAVALSTLRWRPWLRLPRPLLLCLLPRRPSPRRARGPAAEPLGGAHVPAAVGSVRARGPGATRKPRPAEFPHFRPKQQLRARARRAPLRSPLTPYVVLASCYSSIAYQF